jgi:hypothetical protein
VYGKKKDGKQQADQQNFITELQQTGGNPVDPSQTVNVGLRQRLSDQPGAPGDPNNPLPQFNPNGQPIPNGQIVPGQPPGNQFGNQPGLPSQFQTGAPPGASGQPFPGQPFPNQPFQPGFPGLQSVVPGQQPNQPPPTAAAGLIGQILTTPRPGGLNGLGGVQQGTIDPNAQGGTTIGTLSAPTPTATAAQTIGGGIAGVASKIEEDGIKVYKDQTSYHKWEFVYDITKDPARTGGAVPQGAPPPGTPIGGTAPNGSPINGNGTPSMNGTPAPPNPVVPNPAITPPQ